MPTARHAAILASLAGCRCSSSRRCTPRTRARAAGTSPRPRRRRRRRGRPPPHQARDRRARRRAGRVRVRLVRTGPAAGAACATPPAPGDQLPAGRDPRAAAGRRRAVPDLLTRPRRDPAARCSAGTSIRTTTSSSRSSSRRTWRRRSCCSASSGGLGAHRARRAALAARPRDRADDTDARLGWLLVVGTIPAGLLGLLPRTRCARSSPPGQRGRVPRRQRVMLLVAERLRRGVARGDEGGRGCRRPHRRLHWRRRWRSARPRRSG